MIKFIFCLLLCLFIFLFSDDGLTASRAPQHAFSLEDVLQMENLR